MQYLADGSLEHERNSCASGSSVDTPGKRKSLIQRRLLLPIPIGSVHAKRSENLYLTRTYVDMRTQLELMPHGTEDAPNSEAGPCARRYQHGINGSASCIIEPKIVLGHPTVNHVV